jgi:hypothetical protein
MFGFGSFSIIHFQLSIYGNEAGAEGFAGY